MTVEEIKNIIEENNAKHIGTCINNVFFNHGYVFDISEEFNQLYVRFQVANISGIVASIDIEDIKTVE